MGHEHRGSTETPAPAADILIWKFETETADETLSSRLAPRPRPHEKLLGSMVTWSGASMISAVHSSAPGKAKAASFCKTMVHSPVELSGATEVGTREKHNRGRERFSESKDHSSTGILCRQVEA